MSTKDEINNKSRLYKTVYIHSNDEHKITLEKGSNMIFEEFVEIYLRDKQNNNKLSEDTIAQKRLMINNEIIPYLGQSRVSTICPEDIIQWQNHIIAQKYTPTYVKKLQSQLTAIFNHAKKFYDLKNNPCKEIFKMSSFQPTKVLCQQRHQSIINLLLQNDISYKQLEEKLGINKHTRKNDIKILREQYGYEIESHKGILSLKNKEHFPLQQEQISRETIQLLLLLYVLNDKQKKYTEISSSDYFDLDNNIKEYSLRKLIKIARTFSLVDFHESNYTYENNSNLRFFSLPQNSNEVLEFALFCHLSHNVPKKLYNEVVSYLANIGHSVIHSKPQSSLYNLPLYIDKLCQLNYQNDALSFKYSTSSDKETNITFFYVGLIIYSRAKDILYILGRERPTKQSYIICRADRIHWDTICSANNKQFEEKLKNDSEFKHQLKKEFEEIKVEMFDISTDQKEYVKVKFDYSFEIEYEIKHLAEKRNHTAQILYETCVGSLYKTPSVIPQDESITYLIYSDTIRGLGSFSNFIRKFGDKVTVLENESLRRQLLNSATRVIENHIERIRTEHEQ